MVSRPHSLTTPPLLTAEAVHAGYGRKEVLHDVSIEVYPGKITLLIGPNGSGKSTFLKSVFGLATLGSGSIRFDGIDIGRMPPRQLLRMGVAYVPQSGGFFPDLTVEENLAIPRTISSHRPSSVSSRLLEAFPRDESFMSREARSLSGGQRQLLSLAIGLSSRARLVLLDEATVGLAPSLAQSVVALITHLKDEGVAILVVEQNVLEGLGMADWVYGLRLGEIVLSLSPEEAGNRDVLKKLFLTGPRLGSQGDQSLARRQDPGEG